MRDFVAIDFETANSQRSSICSLGLVIVENGKIAERIYSLVKPRPNFYSHFTTAIHGLCNDDTKNAPDFFEVWKPMAKLIEGLPLVAHNSPFDSSCLKAIHDLCGIDYPDYEFYCTLSAARKNLPHLENHKLNTVAKYFDYDLKNHHHALADAEACAVIAINLL